MRERPLTMRHPQQAEEHREVPARGRLIRLQRCLGAGQAAIERRINGQDAEGAVEVVLGTGGLVEQVHLDADWPALQGTDLLPAAVLEAYRSAEATQLAEWADAAGDDAAQGELVRSAAHSTTTAAPSAPRGTAPLAAHVARAAAE